MLIFFKQQYTVLFQPVFLSPKELVALVYAIKIKFFLFNLEFYFFYALSVLS